MPQTSPRLSSTSYAVLGLIGIFEECTPYDLKRYIEQSVENFWPVPHTTFYAEPARLAEAGYLSERREEGGRHRKLYRLTEAGAQALAKWVNEPSAAPPQLRDELMLKLFMGADPRPLVRERLEWHRRKLEELEGYLEEIREKGDQPGVERALVVGTEYQRLVMGMMGEGQNPEDTGSSESGKRKTSRGDGGADGGRTGTGR